MSDPTTDAGAVPVSDPTPVCTYGPIVLPVLGRIVDLQLRVSAPATGNDLPVLLLSHGHGTSHYLSSLYGCAPVANFWAAHGFVVIQPTHLDSATLGLDPTGTGGPLFWQSRVEDLRHVLDQLDRIEAAVPNLAGRVDDNRVAVVGYSLGGHTAAMLLGMRVTDPDDGTEVDLTDARVAAGVLLAPPGSGDGLAPFAAQHFPVLRGPNFAGMTAPALVIRGDADVNPSFSDRADYRADAYYLSPGPKSLLTLYGAQHSLGGVSGYDAAETTDEDPRRLATVATFTWAYLRSQLYPGDHAWGGAIATLARAAEPPGQVESK